ncbi:MAG: hypothetical protein ACOYN0_16995 [Phycisphaerales bacterium]
MRIGPVPLPPSDEPMGEHERRARKRIESIILATSSHDLASRFEEALRNFNFGAAALWARERDRRQRVVVESYRGRLG